MTPTRFSALLGLTACLLATPARAGTLTLYTTQAAFSAAIGGSALAVQDFSGIPNGTNMSGVEFLPGISATTNLPDLEIFLGSLFALGQPRTGTQYDFALSLPYFSLGFDLTSFEAIPGDLSTAVGPGTLTVFLADASVFQFLIAGNLTGAPIFLGLVADTAITGVRWQEPLEGNGFGTEETAFDNFVVATPEPTSLFLLGAGLAGLATRVRRRMRPTTNG